MGNCMAARFRLAEWQATRNLYDNLFVTAMRFSMHFLRVTE